MKKIITALILALVLAALPSCAGGDEKTGENPKSPGAGEAEGQNEEARSEEDKLAEYDFGGAEIRVLTSINASDGTITNSNYMIEGTGKINGEIVNDAVHQRNMDVENLLNVKFKYTQMNEDYGTVQSSISKLMLSGADDYDLIINDLRSLVNLSVQGMFLNIKDNGVFDLNQNYWYGDFMEDVAIGKQKAFILAGDYFIDILRNSHALFLNKTMLETENPGGSDELYKKVIDGKWTLDEFSALTKSFVKDLNGDGEYKNADDRFGFICVGTWGSAIPFMMAANTGVFTKDGDGIPSLSINNPKSMQLHEGLSKLFLESDSGAKSTFTLEQLIPQFMSGRSLMVGYQRLAQLEDLRVMEDEVSILPYPKLSAEQEKYITSSHDTIEVGVIPTTSPNFGMTGVVLEGLNRETKKTVIPAYYEISLKIKYARDDMSYQIIDLIHDSMDNVFPLAYSELINGLLGLYDVGATKNFISSYEKIEAKAQVKLEEVIEKYMGL